EKARADDRPRVVRGRPGAPPCGADLTRARLARAVAAARAGSACATIGGARPHLPLARPRAPARPADERGRRAPEPGARARPVVARGCLPAGPRTLRPRARGRPRPDQ